MFTPLLMSARIRMTHANCTFGHRHFRVCRTVDSVLLGGGELCRIDRSQWIQSGYLLHMRGALALTLISLLLDTAGSDSDIFVTKRPDP